VVHACGRYDYTEDKFTGRILRKRGKSLRAIGAPPRAEKAEEFLMAVTRLALRQMLRLMLSQRAAELARHTGERHFCA
jgi:hypothetical protein